MIDNMTAHDFARWERHFRDLWAILERARFRSSAQFSAEWPANGDNGFL